MTAAASASRAIPNAVATESSDALLSSVAGFLEVDGEARLARLLEDCTLSVWEEQDAQLALVSEEMADALPLTIAVLSVPIELHPEAQRRYRRLEVAVEEALSGELDHFYLEGGPARGWSNQAAGPDQSHAPHVWQGLRFRSYGELAIAEALDRAGLDFQANCAMRLGETPDERVTVEPNFVVHEDERHGVLEVGGGPWHPSQGAAAEHGRDRWFREKGWVVERFDEDQCRAMPDDVVERFLRVLRARPC